jgi:hypothetical protein
MKPGLLVALARMLQESARDMSRSKRKSRDLGVNVYPDD